MKKRVFVYLIFSLVLFSCVVNKNTKEPERLTPFPKKEISLNHPKVFGVRANSPILFYCAASGERPVEFWAENLPQNVIINSKTGIITGKILKEGDYKVQIFAKNRYGKSSRDLLIRVGDDICLTPPMGWNSWYCFSESVSQEKILSIARAMKKLNLADYGWSFINIDDCWQAERGGKYNAIQPNSRFTDIKSMCDEIHSLGLKVGIYSTPWQGSYAGFIGGSCSNAEGDYRNFYIPKENRLQENQFFGRYPGSLTLGLDSVGQYWFNDRDVFQWQDWGIDYVKMDWKPNDVETTKRIFKDLKKANRDIVLSLSNSAPFENAEELSKYSNLWRVTGDIRDTWFSIKNIGFNQQKWYKFSSPGHFNDLDMLQIGNIGVPNSYVKEFKKSKLSADEQYSQMTLWSMLSAPLILSCDIESMDSFTLGLVTNSELIDIDQDVLCSQPKHFKKRGGIEILLKKLDGGDFALAFFNHSFIDKSAYISLEELSLYGEWKVRDVWRQQDLGAISKEITCDINSHGCQLFRLSRLK